MFTHDFSHFFSRYLMLFVPFKGLYVPFRALGPYFLGSCSRLLTITHDYSRLLTIKDAILYSNVPFEVRHWKGVYPLTGIYIHTHCQDSDCGIDDHTTYTIFWPWILSSWFYIPLHSHDHPDYSAISSMNIPLNIWRFSIMAVPQIIQT